MSKLTATDRKDYRKLIETKQEDLIKALNGELFRNKEDLIQEALFSKNYQYNSEELSNKIEVIKTEIDNIVSEFLPEEEAQLEIKIAEASEEIDAKILELKSEYSAKLELLQEERKGIRQKMIGDHSSLVAKIAGEKVPEKLNEKQQLEKDLEEVKFIENSITVEINRKVSLVKKMRYRIQSAINDKINELFEALINAESREEAKELIKSVPTLAELINSCESAEGLATLVQKLSPSLALPAPKQTEPKPEELKPTITIEAKVMEDNNISEEEIQTEEVEEEVDA